MGRSSFRTDGLLQPAGEEMVVVGMTIRGRHFAPKELMLIRAMVENSQEDHRFAISKKICEALDWRQPNGRLKDRSCRAVLAKLHDIGFLCLPPRRRPPVKRRAIVLTDRTAWRLAPSICPCDVGRDSFSIVTGSGNTDLEKLWNEYVERYHYLGYGTLLGPHIKYLVNVDQVPIACLGFCGAAWRVKARDRWIGWSDEERKRNLRYVVNNSRFVIFPWVSIPNLASRLLSLAVKRLSEDWHVLYAYRPLLLETFVHTARHT